MIWYWEKFKFIFKYWLFGFLAILLFSFCVVMLANFHEQIWFGLKVIFQFLILPLFCGLLLFYKE